MGYGDELMATGMARGAKARGKRIAFGDGKNIFYSPWSELLFRDNPNIAKLGDELDEDIEWIAHYKGNRAYNSLSPARDRWVWNMDFRATPGEIFFSETETDFARRVGENFIAIEPCVPRSKSVASNKDWGKKNYEALSIELRDAGYEILQFVTKNTYMYLTGARKLRCPDFRFALAVLQRARLYIGPEGGLHHGSAAVDIPAVVLFGGFIPPQVTGYRTHTNLTGNATSFCGRLQRCAHCQSAMQSINVDRVLASAQGHLHAWNNNLAMG